MFLDLLVHDTRLFISMIIEKNGVSFQFLTANCTVFIQDAFMFSNS